MPYKRKYRRNRKIRKRRGYPKLQRGLAPVPPRTKVRLHVVDSINLNATTAVAQVNNFALNGPYDWNNTTAVTGPVTPGLSAWMTLYKKYVVTNCLVKLTAYPSSTSASGSNIVVGMFPSSTKGGDVTLGGATQMIQQPGAKYMSLGSFNAQGPRSISRKYNISRLVGQNVMKSIEDYSGTATSNPPFTRFINVFCGSPNGTDDPSAIDILVEAWFDIVLCNPVNLVASSE